MISLNDIALLINQIDALLDDSEGDVYSVYINNDSKRDVQMKNDAFLSEFVDFDITARDDEKFSYPYRLSRKIYGVEFFTLMNASEILMLVNTMPEQYEYISKKLQREPA